MATAAIDIYNLALSEIGARASVSSLTESSREAEICGLWYDQTIEQVLATAPWPVATSAQRLALLAERPEADWADGDPLPGYQFTYKLPNDNIRPRYLDTWGLFEVGSFEGESALFTNVDKAILIYTKLVTNPNDWDPALKMAIVYTLAAHIVMPLTGKPARAKEIAMKAQELVIAAHVNAANQNQVGFEPALPDWITARGYGGGVTTNKFIYPSALFLVQAHVS